MPGQVQRVGAVRAEAAQGVNRVVTFPVDPVGLRFELVRDAPADPFQHRHRIGAVEGEAGAVHQAAATSRATGLVKVLATGDQTAA